MYSEDPAPEGPEARVPAPVDLAPAPQRLPADRHPVHVYLARLTGRLWPVVGSAVRPRTSLIPSLHVKSTWAAVGCSARRRVRSPWQSAETAR